MQRVAVAGTAEVRQSAGEREPEEREAFPAAHGEDAVCPGASVDRHAGGRLVPRAVAGGRARGAGLALARHPDSGAVVNALGNVDVQQPWLIAGAVMFEQVRNQVARPASRCRL